MEIRDDILDSITEAVFMVDKEFRIQFFNRSAELITGFNRQEVLGKFCRNVLESDFCQNECPVINALQSSRAVSCFDSNICCKNGQRKKIRLNASLVYEDKPDPVGSVITFREVECSSANASRAGRCQDFYGITGFSKKMTDIFDLILEIAHSDASVLIYGETGTGKELIANAIQATSLRKDKPFVKVNCSVLPSNLLASELFGHVKGAFTDAVKDRTGRFELAHQGTLFLDEVAEMPPQMQLQLLRVIQEGTFERVGESMTRHADVRIISATNLNLNKAIEDGQFREDLFYRLNVVPIKVPPLRERKEDIMFLIKHFLRKFTLAYKKEITEISDEALDNCLKYDWPGNVRELENAIEFAFIRTQAGEPISSSKLPPAVREKTVSCRQPSDKTKLNRMSQVELIALLEKHHWNKTKVASALGVNRTTVWRYLKELCIMSLLLCCNAA
ncbi:MAG TPA: sigma 54-interacting transcriptional regulator [Ignavibacteriales bacterium]|nr:sigma 54-interacting transcriptional regulator [Ignavibacteriales bacterium]